ncbi:MAG: hypothetical protein M3362_09950 [Acidobacteriota bacterium]|nr:hypothetical protein [Acidobacteriota bacterium]
MFRNSYRTVLLLLAAAFVLIIAGTVQAQTAKQTFDTTQLTDPTFHDYNGVTINMTANEVRQKLGAPKDKSAEQDFYVISDKQNVQIFYDNTQKVRAIAINYIGEGSNVPTCRTVLGADATPSADGSVYKLVRYPRAGFWVSYNRTGGDEPLVIVTMQRLAQ